MATLVVAGPGAVEMVKPLFHGRGGRRLAECPSDAVVVGRFGGDTVANERLAGEEIVARRAADDEVLLHCHGGAAAVERLESLLVARGAVPTDWPTWARRRHDRLQVEALVALAEATTEKTAGILLDQFNGALRAAIDAIEQSLGDENSGGDDGAALLDRLLVRAQFGLHLTRPWKVVLAGPPNAGKSSLMNALVGYQRAIVHPTPGTTRDLLTAEAAVEGWPVELIDTAGLGDGDHPVEIEGVRRARAEMAAADLVLLVFDGSRPLGATGWASAAPPADKTLIVYNKSDLPAAPGVRPEGLSTSAIDGTGLPELLAAVAERLVPDRPLPGEAIPWTARQIGRLKAARAALEKQNLPEARRALAAITAD